jgi:hypothetical protein
VLHISENPLSTRAIEQLCEAMRQNTCLEELCIQRQSLGGSACADAFGRYDLAQQIIETFATHIYQL